MKNLIWILFLFPVLSQAQNFDNGYEFYMPPYDSLATKFLPEFPQEPIADFISIGNDGHFYAGSEQIRFWGGNIVSGSCFPGKQYSVGIAARMRKMGMNIVRFHHMDNPWSGQDGVIFDRSTGGTRTFHPEQVDKFHYLLSNMKQNGIYANINLLVSRDFQVADGISDANSLWAGGRVVNLFDPQMIDLQKEYARNLLTAINPYTGLALADDPVVGIVEIANENSIYAYWKNSNLTNQDDGGILLPRHDEMLNQKWNAFLKNKYSSQNILQQAWNTGAGGAGNNQVIDGDFELGDTNSYWVMETHNSAEAEIFIEDEDPFEGDYCMKVEVTEATGTNWHTQFRQIGFLLEAGKSYTVNFAAKADQNRVVTSYAQQNYDPWNWYSGRDFNLTEDWQEFEYVVTPFEDNEGRVRLGFMFDADVGTFWFDNIRLTENGLTGLAANESLASENIERMRYRDLNKFTEARSRDLAEFYTELQKEYFDEMYRFLKEDLGVKVPITGTNAHSGVADIYSNSDLDFIDDHAYWDHPDWDNGWSLNDWSVRNTSMLEDWDLGTMSDVFGGLAIDGKPFTVSEYRHSYPNRYETEMIPLIATYGLFHDIDGVMFFQYNESNWNWEEDKIVDWFSMHRNPALMSLMPVYGKVFREGLVAPAARRVNLKYPKDYINSISRFDWTGRWSDFSPYTERINLDTDVRISDFDSPDVELNFNDLPIENDADVIQTSTFETKFDAENGFVTTVTPRFVAITGKLNNPFQISADVLQITGANDFGTVAWVSLTEEPVTNSRRSFLTISAKAQNSNMNWTSNQNVDNEFGDAPTLMYPLATSLLLEIEADSIQIFPLSATGEASDFTTYFPIAPKTFLVGIDQAETQTPWYGIEAFGDAVSSIEDEKDVLESIRVFPNPASAKTTIVGNIRDASDLGIQLFDYSGKLITDNLYQNEPPGVFSKTLNLENIPSGFYSLKIRIGEQMRVEKLIVE